MARATHEPATLRDWARSLPASMGLLSTLLAFDLPLRALGRYGDRDSLMDAGHVLADVLWQAFRLTGAKLEVHGLEHINSRRRYVILANHQGFSDVIVLSTTLRALQPRYVAKRELAKGWPSVSYMLAASGSAIIDRKHPNQAIGEIERLGRQAKRENWSVVIFPEGTRAKDGKTRSWRPRGTKALLDATGPCEVLPVSLWGGAQLFAHNGAPFRAGVEMGVRVHPSVPSPSRDEDFEAWLEQRRETVAAGLPG